jgi:hypothetical protein
MVLAVTAYSVEVDAIELGYETSVHPGEVSTFRTAPECGPGVGPCDCWELCEEGRCVPACATRPPLCDPCGHVVARFDSCSGEPTCGLWTGVVCLTPVSGCVGSVIPLRCVR